MTKDMRYKYRINDYAKPSKLDTQCLFDSDFEEESISPIDTFFSKTTELNKLIGDPSEDLGQLSILILLGYVSAVESYFREIIRKLILIDIASKEKCEQHFITYGAAMIYDHKMLPEAMMENYSFAGMKHIKEAFKKFLGIPKEYPSAVEETMEQFSKVCQLRHCCVHRFGRLGSQNTIALGLEDHKEYLEKPLKFDFDTLQEIFLVCNNIVKETNNFLFEEILGRNAREHRYDWKWDLRKDKSEFKKIYSLFVSEKNPPTPNPSLKEAYRIFKETFIGRS